MPHTERSCSSSLSIAVLGARTSYSPGDTIVGQVTYQPPIVRSHTTITISLCGRAKARLVFREGGDSAVRRSRYRLIDETQTRQLILSDFVETGPGGYGQPVSIPFSADIPTHVSRRALLSGDEEDSYLPLDEESVAGQELPWSVTAPVRHSRLEAFVEYFLEAKMTGAKAGLKTIKMATLPIVVHSLADGPPIAHFESKMWPQPCTISSPRLIPGMEGSKLSTRDLLKKIFSPDTLPSFSFSLHVGAPTILQLDNPEPVPFTIRAVPNWRSTSQEITGLPQTIRLKSLRLKIESKSVGRASGYLFGPYEQDSDVETDIPLDEVLSPQDPSRKKTFFIPCTDDDPPPLDIGQELKLHLGSSGPSLGPLKRPRPGGPEPRLCPTMTTYNFKVSHVLSWEVRVAVAGEECEARASQPLVILPSVARLLPPSLQERTYAEVPPPLEHLPRSESWILPPAEEDAPPSFEQVQREDLLARGGRARIDGSNPGEGSGT